MPRKARVESKTKIYHVMSRALNKQILFDDEKDYLKFLHIVKSTKGEIDFDLYGYCIMSNHYHLLIIIKGTWFIIVIKGTLLKGGTIIAIFYTVPFIFYTVPFILSFN